MDKLHKDTLQENWPFLMENLTLEYGVLDFLLARHVITLDMIEEINAKATRKDKNYQFLSLLMRRGPSAFDSFLEALRDRASEQNHVAEQLQRTLFRLAGQQEQAQAMEV